MELNSTTRNNVDRRTEIEGNCLFSWGVRQKNVEGTCNVPVNIVEITYIKAHIYISILRMM